MILATFLAMWLTIVSAPGTPIVRWLSRYLVELPAVWLDRITRGYVILALLVLSLGGLAVWAGGGDAARMLGMATPEMLGWIAMFDVATYIDVTVALALAASTLKVRMAVARFVSILSLAKTRRIGSVRARRSRRTVRKAANDDGDDHASCIAA